jgi:hypothetical protein
MNVKPYLEQLEEDIRDKAIVGWPYIASFLISKNRDLFLGYPPRQLLWDFTKLFPEWAAIRKKKQLTMSVKIGDFVMPSIVIVPRFSLANGKNVLKMVNEKGYIERDKLVEVEVLPYGKVVNI